MKSPEKTMSVIDLNSERMCNSLQFTAQTNKQSEWDSNSKFLKKRSEKSDKPKLDKKFIENTHLELNSIKEHFNSALSSCNPSDMPDSRRESMNIDLLEVDEHEPHNVELVDLNHDLILNSDHFKANATKDQKGNNQYNTSIGNYNHLNKSEEVNYQSNQSINEEDGDDNDNELDLSNSKFNIGNLMTNLNENYITLKMNNCALTDSELQSLINVLQNTTNNINGIQLKRNKLSNRCFKTVRDYISLNEDVN